MSRRIGLVALLLLTLTGPHQAAAQGDASFGETVQVRRVNIEVYVTDKKGGRPQDLRREDFQVFEDGQPVPITNFALLRDPAPPTSQPPLLEPPVVSTAPTAPAPAAEPDEDQALHLVLYVDNLHTRPFDRNRVLAQARQFLRQVPAGTQLMLVTFERELHVRQTFTTDVQTLVDHTVELEELSSFVVQKETERDNLIRNLRNNKDDLDSAVSDIDFYAKSVYNDIELSTRALGETMERLAGLPGRKALVYVSGGLDIRPGEDLLTMVYDQFSTKSARTALPIQFNRHSTREFFRDLTQLANAHGVTFYTIDAGGLRASSATAADRGSSSTTDADFLWQVNRQDSLVFMAAETGGLAAIGTNNFAGAFEGIAGDLRAGYSLAIRPRSQDGDGRYHRLKVKVSKPGLELRYRDGYRDKSIPDLLEEATVAALLYGNARNPLGVELNFLPMQPKDDGYLVPIEVRIPIGKLTLLPIGDFAKGRLRVALTVADSRGDLSPTTQQEVPLEIPAADLERARQQVYVYTATLHIAAGRQKVIAAVRDEIAGTDAFATRGIELAAP